MPPLLAGAAAAATAVTGEAFKYNRENYMFDNTLRFQRYATGYQMAITQANQYREDIRDMTEFTVTKADTYHTVGVICFVLNFQLIMAGRLGVHGPAPPGWLLGLYWANICSALMFLVTFTWLAMHAGARATAGAAHMLTRSVRLPIPTPKQLDKARTTGNSFEKQRLTDMFRIPFVSPAPFEAVEEEDPETGARSKTRLSDRRVPKWYQDETKDLHVGESGQTPSGISNPEHFELYRGLQEEWWGHDIYARIGLLYFFSHWLSAVSLYSISHVFSELRLLWPAWTVVAMFVTAHYNILRLDIVNIPREGGLNIQVEKVVPLVPAVACLGMSLDYSVWEPTPGLLAFIYFLGWVCYATYFCWSLRIYDLAAPQRQKEREEAPGAAWWPSEWMLPPAFQDALYLVAAPKHLEPGQTCLLQEMRAAKGQKSLHAPVKKAKPAEPAMFPWKLFRGACVTTICMWLLIMAGRIFEQVNGERMLLRQSGKSEAWPMHVQGWMTPWTRAGSPNEYCHAGGCDRRLSQEDLSRRLTAEELAVTQLAQRLLDGLQPIAAALETRAVLEEGLRAAPLGAKVPR